MTDLSNVVFFGDSLSDQRNMHDLTSRTTIITIPVEGMGYGTAFTNGLTHATVTGQTLGLGVENYAVGGARAVGSLTLENYIIPRIGNQIPGLDVFQPGADPDDLNYDLYLGGQIGRFVADAAATPVEPGTAAAFFIGLNDYSENPPSTPEQAAALIQSVLGATFQAAAATVAAGVETVLFYTLPDVGFFPYSAGLSPESVALGNQIIAAHNAGLAAGAPLIESLGAEVEIIDLNRVSGEIAADPLTFGLRPEFLKAPALLATGGNPTLVEQPDGTYVGVFPANPAVAGVDVDELAFWDLIHPSETTHAIWGVFSARSLTDETFFLGDGPDVLRGASGPDLVLAGAGDDRIRTRGGPDTVLAGLGDDQVRAGGGDDIVAGGSGNDRLHGGAGADVLAGGPGRNMVHGGAGGDALIAGGVCERLSGGAGADAFILIEGRPGAAPSGRMVGGAGCDTLYLAVGDETRAAVEAEFAPGGHRQELAAIGFVIQGIEKLVFLDAAAEAAGIPTAAPIGEAALWGLI